MTNKITDLSYSFVERPLSEFYSVRIKEGIYAGNIVTFGKVSIREDKGSPATLQFTYRLEEVVPPFTTKELDESKEFKTLLGDVLTHIITTAFERGEYKIGSNKPNVRKSTDDDSVETDS